MVNQSDPQLDRLFHALADPTRRHMLQRLAQTPQTVSALAHAHRCDAGAMEMAHEVSSIGWNAERVLQSIVAALACANALDGSIDEMTIGIELVLPSFADYVDSWYNRRVQART